MRQLQWCLPQQCCRIVLVGQNNCFFPVYEGGKENNEEEEEEVEEEEGEKEKGGG